MFEIFAWGACIIFAGGVAGVNKLKSIRKKEFDAYLASEELRMKHLKAEHWMVDAVDIPIEIDYNATMANYNKTGFWSYDFRDLVVVKRKDT